jgi:hypothetical protein
MTIVVDKDKALELLDKAVAEKGADHTVDGCVYFEGGAPHCIVGHVLAEVGVTESDFEDAYNKGSGYDPNGQSFGVLYTRDFITEKVKFTSEAAQILEDAQQMQDYGVIDGLPLSSTDITWGTAVRVAREAAAND